MGVKEAVGAPDESGINPAGRLQAEASAINNAPLRSSLENGVGWQVLMSLYFNAFFQASKSWIHFKFSKNYKD
jgi:hypothetical protein